MIRYNPIQISPAHDWDATFEDDLVVPVVAWVLCERAEFDEYASGALLHKRDLSNTVCGVVSLANFEDLRVCEAFSDFQGYRLKRAAQHLPATADNLGGGG